MSPSSEHNRPLAEPHDFEIDSDDDVTYQNSPASTSHVHGSRSPYKDGNLPKPDYETPSIDERQLSFINQDVPTGQPEIPVKAKEEPVTWMSLPHKRQLAVLTMARLSEPLVQTSLQSYMFFQLQSFNPSLPDSTIAAQAGIMQASFTAAQFLTAMLWGRVSDSDWGGRKLVLMIGLLATLISVVGFGFSRTYTQAIMFRTMGGAFNGNIGVMRTMISEIIREKKFQSRAFLLLPMCFNIGVIIGPILGGLLADPAASYPSIFGHVAWLKKFPYAPPNILSACFLLIAAIGVFFGLEETLETLRHKDDIGVKCGRKLASIYRHHRNKSSITQYSPINNEEQSEELLSGEERRSASADIEAAPVKKQKKVAPRYKSKLPFKRIFTSNVSCTLLAHGILASHIGTFNAIFYIFLSTPVYDPEHPSPPGYTPHPPFIFTGGIGMKPRNIGLALAILGTIGITLQLVVYPRVNAYLGTVRSWRIFLYCFPVAYILVPFLAQVRSTTPPPAGKTGLPIWLALIGVLSVQVIGRTFALPATTILINNCSPHPSVLGTIHGIGQSVSSAARTVGPVLGAWLYGVGLNHGVVGVVWWALSGVAVCAIIASMRVREGDGHEIYLEGDAEAEEEAERINETR